ncbi:MAG: formylglycine-generating enzyme family protein [Deltaproteobacteria bacterium]|nr:formylglycine-generating enzyme family protein [Deltaproteobacteria bacterium]
MQGFIQKLNEKEETDIYRLPFEAEWEYAARADTESAYFFRVDINTLTQYAWYRKNSDRKTRPVGRLKPNPWGLHDVHGNVHEWCQDWFDKNYYSSEDWYCRCASRSLSSPDRRSSRVGFRLIKTG